MDGIRVVMVINVIVPVLKSMGLASRGSIRVYSSGVPLFLRVADPLRSRPIPLFYGIFSLGRNDKQASTGGTFLVRQAIIW